MPSKLDVFGSPDGSSCVRPSRLVLGALTIFHLEEQELVGTAIRSDVAAILSPVECHDVRIVTLQSGLE